MAEVGACIRCRSPLPDGAPTGVCPGCMCLGEWTASLPPGPLASTLASEGTGSLDSAPAGVVESPNATPHPGGLSNYDLLEEIGAGGMGVVYRARQRGADRIVALKMIRGGGAIDPAMRERFRTEVRALARLRHPNVVQVYEVGEDGGQPFFSLEYMEGGSLAAKLRADGLFDPTAAAELVRVLAGAVAAAHAAGVLHRDIKPGNVLLSDASLVTPKLTDFGLARWLDAGDGITGTGAMLGTPSYMAPEQAAGRNAEVGPHTDVYALGATLYELLTGQPPFRADSPLVTAAMVINAEPRPPRSLRPEVSPELEAICLKCLEKRPTGRYATAEELAADLSRWLRGESTVARPLSRPRRMWRSVRRRPWAVAAVLGAVLLLGGGFAAARLYTAYYAPLNIDPDQPDPPDPDAVVKEYTRQLAAGNQVTLIGQSGKPQWHRWVVGKGTVDDAVIDDVRVDSFYAPDLCVLELLPDPGCDTYSITGEFYLNVDQKGEMQYGLVFGYQEVGRDPGVRVARFFQAGIDVSALKTKVALFNDWLVVWPPGGGEGKRAPVAAGDKLDRHRSSPLSRPFKLVPVPEPSSLWQKVVVQVSPAAVTVSIGANGNAPTPLLMLDTSNNVERPGVWSRDKFAVRLSEWHRKIDLNYPRVGLRLREWTPRMPIGVVVRNAGVAFRNVVVEPVRPGSQ